MPVNVPRVPGVPPVAFAAGVEEVIRLLTRDLLSFTGFPSPAWGIYSGGAPVVTAESVLTFDYRRQSALADFQIEQGGFANYNKVDIPADARFRFAAGQNASARQALLDSIAAIAGDLNLYNIVTPEAVYIGFNVTHFDYARAAMNGVGLLTVDVWTLEVRIVAGGGGGLSNTFSPTDASQVNTGPVQPTPALPHVARLGF